MDIFSRIIGEVILWLVAMVLWITANLPAILMYTVLACCAIIPLAFWLFSMDNTIAWVCTVFGVQRGMTWNHFKQGARRLILHLFVHRCLHVRSCRYFEDYMTYAAHDELSQDEINITRQLRADLNTKLAQTTTLSASTETWKGRAETAEGQRRMCLRHHHDDNSYMSANQGYRARVAQLEKENANIKKQCNREQMNKDLPPRFNNPLGGLSGANRDLILQIAVLQGRLRNVRDGLSGSQPLSTGERAGAHAEINKLNQALERCQKQNQDLSDCVEEFEAQKDMADDDEKALLR